MNQAEEIRRRIEAINLRRENATKQAHPDPDFIGRLKAESKALQAKKKELKIDLNAEREAPGAPATSSPEVGVITTRWRLWLYLHKLVDEGIQRKRRKAVAIWGNRYRKLNTAALILKFWKQDNDSARESLANLYVASALAGVPQSKEYRRWRARLDKLLETLPCDIESGYIHTGDIEEAVTWALTHIPKPGATSRGGRDEVIKAIVSEEKPESYEADVALEKQIFKVFKAEGIPVPTVRKTGRNEQHKQGRLRRKIRAYQNKK